MVIYNWIFVHDQINISERIYLPNYIKSLQNNLHILKSKIPGFYDNIWYLMSSTCIWWVVIIFGTVLCFFCDGLEALKVWVKWNNILEKENDQNYTKPNVQLVPVTYNLSSIELWLYRALWYILETQIKFKSGWAAMAVCLILCFCIDLK